MGGSAPQFSMGGLRPPKPPESLPVASFPVASFPVASFPVASFPVASFPVASFPVASFPDSVPCQHSPTPPRSPRHARELSPEARRRHHHAARPHEPGRARGRPVAGRPPRRRPREEAGGRSLPPCRGGRVQPRQEHLRERAPRRPRAAGGRHPHDGGHPPL